MIRCFALLRSVSAFAALLAISVAGCSPFQGIKLSYAPPEQVKQEMSRSVAIKVYDDRPYVKGGSKAPSYLGHLRGGYGNTWNMNTHGNIPLASQMENDLTAELKSLGYTVVSSGAERTVEVSLRDFNYDAYFGGKFWYAAEIRILDGAGKTLYTNKVSESSVSPRSINPGGVMHEFIPRQYSDMLSRLIRKDAKAVAALSS